MAKVLTEAAEIVGVSRCCCFGDDLLLLFSLRKVLWHALLLPPFKGGAGS